MSRGATARLFVAAQPPVRVCEELADWARRVAVAARAGGSSRGALRVLAVQSLHLTLCFLGSRPVAELDALGAAVAACEEHTCALSVGAPVWLPPRRPRALAVEIRDHDGELARLQARVSAALAAAGSWKPERGRFRPHITVVRGGTGTAATRRERCSGAAGAQAPLPATPWLDFAPEAIVLYRSSLTPAGASYQELARSELAPSGG
jgi:RNA 2',3'-cyclic 3'-phosphodiesterase